MEIHEFKLKLENQAKTSNLDQFFEEAQLLIAPAAAIQSLLIILKSRYTGLKMDRIKGVLSETEERITKQELQKDILDWVSLVEAEDLAKMPVNVQSLWDEIDDLQKEMESVTNERTDGIINAGHSLANLGSILRGEKGALKENIPLPELIKSASAKAKRKLTIAESEIRAVKKYQYQTFHSMMHAYRNLLKYLDYPTETVNLQDKKLLELALFRLRNYISTLEKGSASIIKGFKDVIDFLSMVLGQKDKLIPLIGDGIADFEAMKSTTLSILGFYREDDQKAMELAARLKTISIELELSIRELSI